MKPRTRVAALVLAGLALLPLSIAPANAYPTGFDTNGPNWYVGTSCPGGQIDSGSLYGGKDRYGLPASPHPTARWYLYYSPNDGGTNCLIVRDNMAGSHLMSAAISDGPMYMGKYSSWATDQGTYSTYAGAVGVRGMKGKCVGWEARITDNGWMYTTLSRDGVAFLVGHCG